VIEAEHLCMNMRGIRKAGARSITSAVRGTLRTSPATARRRWLSSTHAPPADPEAAPADPRCARVLKRADRTLTWDPNDA